MRPLALTLGFLAVISTAAQSQDPVRSDTARAELVRVFVDCQTSGCDDEFFRTEIAWVNFVRDRTVANVFVLVTTQRTGSGGQQYTVSFDGQGPFTGVKDSLVFSGPQGATEDDSRRALARALSLGLVRYARTTSIGERLQVSLQGAREDGRGSAGARGAHDRWNLWVYSISANTFANGDATYKSANLFGNVNATRVTEEWKTNLGVNLNFSENEYKLSGGTLTNRQHAVSFNGLLAKSVGPRLSAGMTVDANTSRYENYRLALSAMPAVEFDLFPYKESTRRQLLLRYGVGMRTFSYDSTTIYGKQRETRAAHELTLASEARQKWGSLSVGVTGSQYLDDLSKRRLAISGNVSWRVVRGLEFNVGGFYEVSRDQLNIPRGTLGDEDILIRLRQLQSGYNYFVSVGLSYTFGSIFNNVVNPRFGRGGRGFTIRM